jgi:hypothetical protein
LLLVVLACIGSIGGAFYYVISTNVRESAAQDHFVSMRREEAKQRTNNIVEVTDLSSFDGERRDVTVKIGSCSGFNGYFTLPKEPTKLEDVSQLRVKIPLTQPSEGVWQQFAEVAVDDPTFGAKLKASTILGPCVAGSPQGQQ